MVSSYHRAFARSAPDHPDPRVVIVPVPYDRTASYQVGTRRGPDAILDASGQLEFYDEALGFDPRNAGIRTLAPLPPSAAGPHVMTEDVRAAVRDVLAAERLPVVLGGDHSVTIGAASALFDATANLSVLQLDAHADLRDTYEGSPVSHACVMRRVRERGHAVSVGIRSFSEEEAAWMAEHDPAIVRAEEVQDVARVNAALGTLTENVYVTIDVDVFDPSIMPATGTPEPGGLTWQDVDRVLGWVARNRRIVGFDVVELMPIPGFVAPDFLAAKLCFRTIGRALASCGWGTP